MLGESLRRREARRRPVRRKPPGGSRRGWRFWVPALCTALVVPFAIGYLVTVYLVFPPREVVAAGIPVPELVGRGTLEAERRLAQAGLGRLQILEVPHPSAPEGQVLAQSPLPQQQLREGSDVRVSVSSGPVQQRIPDLLGQPADRAEEALRRLGFTVDRVEGESPVAAGRVFGLAPAPGTVVTLPAHATLHISLGPPPPDSLLLPDSLAEVPPDTLARAR